MERLQAAGIEVSLFLDPDQRQIETAKLLGARAVEIQTARYSEAKTPAQREEELAALRESAALARQHGLHVHLGQHLNARHARPDLLREIDQRHAAHARRRSAASIGVCCT
jgi:pyridoxine 5-phosphate synthase